MNIGDQLRQMKDAKVEGYDMSCRAMGRLIAQQIKIDFMTFVRDKAPEKLSTYIEKGERPSMARLHWYPEDDQKYPCNLKFFENEMERMNQEVQKECNELYGFKCSLKGGERSGDWGWNPYASGTVEL